MSTTWPSIMMPARASCASRSGPDWPRPRAPSRSPAPNRPARGGRRPRTRRRARGTRRGRDQLAPFEPVRGAAQCSSSPPWPSRSRPALPRPFSHLVRRTRPAPAAITATGRLNRVPRRQHRRARRRRRPSSWRPSTGPGSRWRPMFRCWPMGRPSGRSRRLVSHRPRSQPVLPYPPSPTSSKHRRYGAPPPPARRSRAD